MRRFYKSTEFWKSIVLIGVFHFLAHRFLDLWWTTVYFNSFVASYVIGRYLWKKNRGQFQSGALCSEMYFCIGAEGWNIWALYYGLDPQWSLGLLLGMGALYNLVRGLTKSMGVKTQMIFR